MNKKWHTKVFKKDSESWHGAMAGIADPGEFADSILAGGNYASLFVYMFRRFGISEYGSDPYKEIACWYLTTPDPAVVLLVSPRPSGLRLSFGYMINTEVYHYKSHDDIEAIRLKIEPFLKQAMSDLLTPTNIRDVFINAVGKINDDIKMARPCAYSKWAGFGVTPDYYKKFKSLNL